MSAGLHCMAKCRELHRLCSLHFLAVVCSLFFSSVAVLPGRMLIVYLWYYCSGRSADCLLFACKESAPVTKQRPQLSAPHKSLPQLVWCFSSSTHLNCPQGVNLESAAYLPNISTAISFQIFGNSFSKMPLDVTDVWQTSSRLFSPMLHLWKITALCLFCSVF